MSNGDRIRQMTDDELAHFICQLLDCSECPFAKNWNCDVKSWLKDKAIEIGELE